MPKPKNIITQKQATAYLQNVLKEWTAFLESHKPFKSSLKIILKILEDRRSEYDKKPM